MKRRFILCVCIVMLLCGCVQRPVETDGTEIPEVSVTETKPTKTTPPEKEKLYVAYMETDRASVEIIKAFTSETTQIVPVILAEDDFDDYLIHPTYIADVVLIPGSTQISTPANALGFMVKRLNRLMPEITAGVDYFPVLDAGVIDGSQYFLPLRFQLPYMLTTQVHLDALELTQVEQYDMKEWMSRICTLSESYGDEERKLILMPEVNVGSALYDALRFSGVWTADPTALGTPVKEEHLQVYGQYIKTLWEETERIKGRYPSVGHAAHPYPSIDSRVVSFVLGEGCLPDSFRIFAESYAENPVFLGMPQYESAHTLTADITLYALSYKDDKKQAEISEFLRHAFTTPAGQGALEGLSVCRTAVEAYMDTLAQQPLQVYVAGSYSQKVEGLDKSVRQACDKLFDQIASGSIRNAYWDRVFSDAMEECMRGEKTYEECMQKLKDRLYSSPDETDLSMAEIRLTDELRAEIDRERTFTSYSERYPQFRWDWCSFEDGEYIYGEKTYYGIFRENIIFRPLTDSPLCPDTTYKIGNVVMEYGADFELLVYRNGVFFDLEDAYKRGYITEEDAAIIADRLAYHEQIREN